MHVRTWSIPSAYMENPCWEGRSSESQTRSHWWTPFFPTWIKWRGCIYLTCLMSYSRIRRYQGERRQTKKISLSMCCWFTLDKSEHWLLGPMIQRCNKFQSLVKSYRKYRASNRDWRWNAASRKWQIAVSTKNPQEFHTSPYFVERNWTKSNSDWMIARNVGEYSGIYSLECGCGVTAAIIVFFLFPMSVQALQTGIMNIAQGG